MKMSRKLFFGVLALAVVALAGQASLAGEKLWVSDELQLTVRSGPTLENKILAIAKTGDWVEVLQDNAEGWVRVRLANGKEGWLLKRYLSADRPAMVRLAEISPQASEMSGKLEALTKENQQLSQKVANLEAVKTALEGASQKLAAGGDKITELISDNASLKQQLQQSAQQLKQAEERYVGLARDSGDTVNLQKERDQLRETVAQQKAKLDELSIEVESLRSAGSLKWFLAGAGVLLIGWLMGLSLHRRKRRQGLLD